MSRERVRIATKKAAPVVYESRKGIATCLTEAGLKNSHAAFPIQKRGGPFLKWQQDHVILSLGDHPIIFKHTLKSCFMFTPVSRGNNFRLEKDR